MGVDVGGDGTEVSGEEQVVRPTLGAQPGGLTREVGHDGGSRVGRVARAGLGQFAALAKVGHVPHGTVGRVEPQGYSDDLGVEGGVEVGLAGGQDRREAAADGRV